MSNESNKPISIVDISQTEVSTDSGGRNIITITLSDNRKFEFYVMNGKGGRDGNSGGKWYFGTYMNHTNEEPQINTSTGVANAVSGDIYLNTTSGYLYECVVPGNPNTAKWLFKTRLKGKDGDSQNIDIPQLVNEIQNYIQVELRKAQDYANDITNSVSNSLNSFADHFNSALQDLQNQADGQIDFFYQEGTPLPYYNEEYEPAKTNEQPYKEWFDIDEENGNTDMRDAHIGDLYLDLDRPEVKGYRFVKVEDTYQWVEITDTDSAEALRKAYEAIKATNDLRGIVDGKVQVFASSWDMTPPYDANDLWYKPVLDEYSNPVTVNGVIQTELWICVTANNKKDINGEYPPFSIDHWQNSLKYTDDTLAKKVEQDYIKLQSQYDEWTASIEEETFLLNKSTDGQIENWFHPSSYTSVDNSNPDNKGIPTLNTKPASNWNTDKLKENHVGDTFLNKDNNRVFRFTRTYNYNNGNPVYTYLWEEITNSSAGKAILDAAEAYDVADGKRRTFIGTANPTVPYDIGDLWIKAFGDTTDKTKDNGILVAIADKEEGELFNAEDWKPAGNLPNYSDLTELDNQIDIANKNYASTLNALNKINEDSVFSIKEKNTMKPEWEAISGVKDTTTDPLNTEGGVVNYGTYFATVEAIKKAYANPINDSSSENASNRKTAEQNRIQDLRTRFTELQSFLNAVGLYNGNEFTFTSTYSRDKLTEVFVNYHQEEQLANDNSYTRLSSIADYSATTASKDYTTQQFAALGNSSRVINEVWRFAKGIRIGPALDENSDLVEDDTNAIFWDAEKKMFVFNAPIKSTGDIIAFGTDGSTAQTVTDVIEQYLKDHNIGGGGGYNPPTGGIPKTDLASDVQTSLGKADTALQVHQSLDVTRHSYNASNESTDTSVSIKQDIFTLSNVNHLQWGTLPNALIDKSTLAFWNGRYQDGKSNLLYFANGEIDSVSARNSALAGYLPLGGGQMTGTLKVGQIESLNSKSSISLSDLYLVLGYNCVSNGIDTYLDGKNIHLRCGTNWTEAITINSNANVGIGTTSPSGKLHIYQSAWNNGLVLQRGANNAGCGIRVLNNLGNQLGIFGVNGSKNFELGLNDANGTEQTRLYILGSNGNVGIGTDSPSYKLHVEGSIYANGNLRILGTTQLDNTITCALLTYNASATNNMDGGIQCSNGVIGIRNNGTTTDPHLLGNGGKLVFGYNRYDSNKWGHIGVDANGDIYIYNPKNDFYPYNGRLNNPYYTWRHSYNGTNYAYYAQAHEGKLKIGNGVAKSIIIDSNGNLSAVGDISAYSDRRLKSEIKDLEFRGSLSPKTYIKDGKKCIGFIAQEVRELYPELVLGEEKENEYLSLNYGAITAVLASENKELKKKIKSLEERIERLENLINKLMEEK